MARMEATEEARIAALFREKKFLSYYISPDKVKSSSVQRAGADLLRETTGWSRGEHTRLILLDFDGRKICEAGRRIVMASTHWWRPSTWFKLPRGSEENFYESLEDAIEKCPAKDKIHFVLLIRGNDYINYKVIIFKAPSKLNLMQSIEEDIRKAHGELEEQLRTIDGDK
ncbi:MAG: hypothetical protein WC238_03425 [Parcubacteria group bacterium]|jgi:hypothetical protein